MRSMEAGHSGGETGLLGFVLSVGGFFCMVTANAQPSEIRSWTAFSLGAIASIISIAINWKKFIALFTKKK